MTQVVPFITDTQCDAIKELASVGTNVHTSFFLTRGRQCTTGLTWTFYHMEIWGAPSRNYSALALFHGYKDAVPAGIIQISAPE